MKFPEGTQGKGVVFADSIASASSLLDAFSALNQPFIIQEYLETGGTDLRVLVVGDKAIAAMRRKATTDEKRANIHAGGTGSSAQISHEVAMLAIKTARALGADVAGVDILESPRGPMVIEANISPGLQGISAAHPHLDIAAEIAKFFAQKTSKILKEQKVKQSTKVFKEMQDKEEGRNELITQLQFKGERIVLPSIITKTTGFNALENYVIKSKKGKLEIEEFNL